jgi:exonuclease III
MWRIIIGNINSFPGVEGGTNKYKLERFKKLVIGNEGDIVLLSEHNKNLSVTKHHNQPAEIMKRWWPSTITRASYLASTSKAGFEPGGTMIITHSKATAHTCQAGEDKQQLGRWNYITLRGKKEQYTTIISIYRPSKYQETYLRQTAYTAKRRKTLQLDDTPDSIWYSDLKALIQEKIELGHQVIVGGDFNDNLNNNNSKTNKFMWDLGMRELMNEQQGNGPATHIRGSTKIDGIFAMQGIRPSFIQYTSFEQSPSDHRWIIIDIPETLIVGTARDDKRPPLMRKCTSKIPSVKLNFQNAVESQVKKHNLNKRIMKLYETACTKATFSSSEIEEYEIIEERMQRAIKYGDRKCRKARMGAVAFSPEQKRLMGSILILKQMKLRFLLKGKHNRPKSKRIHRLMKKYKYKGTKAFSTMDQINNALQHSIVEYNNFKQGAKENRWSHLEKLAMELDQISGKGIQQHFKILKHNEQTKDYFAAIR